MEVAFQADKSERGCVENSGNIGLESASLKHVADPVVYKLVRIDLDGRLVPATDDELAEVENLLESENDYLFSGSDVFDMEKDDSNTSQNEGSTRMKNEDVDAGVNPHLKDSLHASESNSKLVDKSHNIMDTLGVENGKINSCGSGPNFSLLKGDINLDQLTIRELQETFRATFGRKTSVKDKVWLKRRIAMGLTNSCDVSATSFLIGDGKLLQKSDDICDGGEVGSSGDDMSANTGSHLSLSTDAADSVISMTSLDESAQRAAKRFRKPRKRYIEELSEKETSDNTEKSVVSSKDNEHDKPSLSSANKTGPWSVNTGAFVTRRDLFGGSRVQVPYVSRVRRCRPRQSIMNIVKFDLNEVTLTRKKVESSDEPNKSQFDTGSKVKSVDDKSIHHEDLMAINESAEKQSMTSMLDSTQKRELKIVDSGDYVSRDDDAGANSDDNVATVPTAKGGMRRKHHRAWTLTEVVKLVDGVSKFGPGHWSEIKRLSFSSYSYRTAVDLKDKWRNLLKASFATLPAENGMNYRMKTPLLIPAPILVKVRELAEINGQTPK